jgi:hypothetical protein
MGILPPMVNCLLEKMAGAAMILGVFSASRAALASCYPPSDSE